MWGLAFILRPVVRYYSGMKKHILFGVQYVRNILASTALLLSIPILTHAATAGKNDIQGFLVTISFFIKEIILPFLFGIAFLFFLINTVRYFILGGANESDREKAKRSAVYGIAAFVFILTLWSMVTILIQGIGIEKGESLCPDYLKGVGVCKTTTTAFTPGGSFPASNGSTNTYTGSTGGTTQTSGASVEMDPSAGGGTGLGTNSYSGGTNSYTGGSSNSLGIAELIFGTGTDSAVFTTYAGSPRAQFQTPIIAENATCADGLATLKLASRVETTQAAYALYKKSTGAAGWKNITDLNSMNHIGYDKDVLSALLLTDIQNVHIIHTHPRTRSENLSIPMESHGPSAADMLAMCSVDNARITYGVVDWSGIWTLQQSSDTCPYITSAKSSLSVIETYGALASVEAAMRESELANYTGPSVAPSQYKTYFRGVEGASLASLSPEGVLALGNGYQQYASTTVRYMRDINNFCSTF